MKVLFAVSNESISESIVKKYQKDYKEIISYKNVYYFNAILKEIERDKTYDRIVISEDLEPFANNNYETIDRFIFERLDAISDEAQNGEGNDTPIILICTDRRSKADNLLLKIFSIGIYNAILGQDRSIEEVCKLINKPRTKKDAKIYYKIDSDDASYQSEDEDSVSETEIQNIIAHYKRLGKNTERYVDSFNNIATQYTDQQLKVIIKFLPLNVKAILEAESPRYQEVMAFSDGKKKKVKAQVRVKPGTGVSNKKGEKAPKLEDIKIDLLDEKINEPISDVIIPSNINKSKVKKAKEAKKENKVEIEELETIEEESSQPQPVKKGRGRPKKVAAEEKPQETVQKRGRGRPKKVQQEIIEESEELDEENALDPIDLFDLSDEKEETYDFDVENEEESEEENESVDELKPIDLFDLSDEGTEEDFSKFEESPKRQMVDTSNLHDSSSIESLITKDKKIVAFVGAAKNGTSFLVNNLAFQLAQNGINTAILDVTQNKNSYYIYTKNEEQLRKKAFECIDKLKMGTASGIEINKNLTVYTSLPGTDKDTENITSILSTVIKKHSIVLLDCDFETDIEYFANAQEIYLVQSMDILTIQPLTAFLRDLKTKNILNQDKLRVVINKELKVKGLTPKVLIGGMSFYNEPAMTFMTELFNKDKIKFCSIPFEVENYIKYLEALVDCNISINNYSKTFVANLKALSNLVYPLLSRQPYQSNVVENNYVETQKDTKVKKLFKFNK